MVVGLFMYLCTSPIPYWRFQNKYVLFFACGKKVSYYKENVESTIEHRWGYLYHPQKQTLRLEEAYLKLNGKPYDFQTIFVQSADSKVWSKASNGKLIAHKSMLPYASYRIRLFKTILSALTLNQFNETDIEFAGKKSIKQQGKNVDVYAISVPSENATVYVDMEKFKILALKKITDRGDVQKAPE